MNETRFILFVCVCFSVFVLFCLFFGLILNGFNEKIIFIVEML